MRTEPTGASADAAPPASPRAEPLPSPAGAFRARLAEASAAARARMASSPPASRGARADRSPALSHVVDVEDARSTLRGARVRRARRPEDEAASVAPDLLRFQAPPAVLSPPTGVGPAAPAAAVGPELAALVERFLTSVRVGRLSDGTSVVRLRVDGRGRGDVDVELRGTPDGLVAVVDASDGDLRRASEWAERLDQALRARGLDVGAVDVR